MNIINIILHPLFPRYRLMIERCYNEQSIQYKDYGSRGISIDFEWLDINNGFENFTIWMIAHGWNKTQSRSLHIDRINNNGPYSPINCRLVNAKQNGRNKRNNNIITAWGETKCLTEWAEDTRCKITADTLGTRIKSGNMTPEDAISTTPIPHKYGGDLQKLVNNGSSTCSFNALKQRLAKGLSKEEALTKPFQIKNKIYTAFNENKTLLEWSKDARCPVTYVSLRYRVLKLNWSIEKSIQEPKRKN